MTAADRETIAFVWDNFGPPHNDRCEALARLLSGHFDIVGLELFSRSQTYSWIGAPSTNFRKVTLFDSRGPSFLKVTIRLLRTLLSMRTRHIFLCHYQEKYILLTAICLRALGKKTYFMGDSKFDDYPRTVGREWLKSLYLIPYVGALTASARSREYLQFLGWKKKPIELGYDTVSVARIRDLAGTETAPGGVSHAERHFTIVARHVPKKNISTALRSFANFAVSDTTIPRRKMVLCGSGPLEPQLKAQAKELSIEHLVEFRGFLQTEEVCKVLAKTLCLILPSIEEQFGQVVPEALAMGVPVILSINCGARDELVRSGVNGFVIEPDNAAGLQTFMNIISSDSTAWARMSEATKGFVSFGNADRFAKSVANLVGHAI